MDNFLNIKYFKPDSTLDAWGDAQKIERDLLLKLDSFREYCNTPLYVTSGYRASSTSQHGLGKAVDIVAPGWGRGLLDLYLAAERFNFKGIGIYPYWHYNNLQVGGLHLDIRDKVPARWLSFPTAERRNNYTILNKDTLQQHGVI